LVAVSSILYAVTFVERIDMSSHRQDYISRRRFLKGAAALTCVSTFASHDPLAAQPEKRPNILYLMTDQMRGDCIACAGNSAIKTPNLDALAREGTLFSCAHSSTPTCTPARSALLTGLSPWHHGMLGFGEVADQYRVELPQALRDADYWTFGIGKMHWAPRRSLHGFHGTLLDETSPGRSKTFVSDYERWFKKQAPDLDPFATRLGWNDCRARVYALAEELHPTWWTGRKAVEFIETYHKPDPFLLKASFVRPHSPYDPPKRFMDMYAEDDMPDPHIGKWAAKFAEIEHPMRYNLWHGDLGLKHTRHSRRGYYASVTFVDEQIGLILQALKKRHMYDNTLIIFLADHGDMLGDHHHWRKSYPYEGSTKVPMILRWPKSMGYDNRRGTTLAHPVELRDVLPTFLDVAGADIPDHLDGMSLLNLVRDESTRWRPYVDMEHNVCYHRENHWNALTDGKIKYIYNACTGREQLFNLASDPGEIHNLAEDHARQKTLKDWRNQLVRHLEERGKPFVSDGELLRRPQGLLYSPMYPRPV
jgi:choline-sulfatase